MTEVPYTVRMNQKTKRALGALMLALAAAVGGYLAGGSGAEAAADAVSFPAQTVEAPPAGSTRVIYSLDGEADKEIIAIIEDAEAHVYFAIYTFTLPSIADALVAAKARGLDVRGLVDSGESGNSYNRPIIEKLAAADIPVLTEKHAGGNGIMHLKLLVTESAYAMGSYNWTKSANTINDEIIEIGTDPTLVGIYRDLLLKLYEAYRGTNAAAQAAAPLSAGDIDYTDAPGHVGEEARVHGTLVRAYPSKSGTVFLDFCADYKSCPFSGVIFADDAKRFGDLSDLAGERVVLSGTVTLYEGRAEIKLSDPSQLSVE